MPWVRGTITMLSQHDEGTLFAPTTPVLGCQLPGESRENLLSVTGALAAQQVVPNAATNLPVDQRRARSPPRRS